MSDDKRKQPKSDFGKCVGEDVELYLAEADELSVLKLPIEDGKIAGRLVGVDRPGLWIEPEAWLKSALDSDSPVNHVFVKWDNVLTVVRPVKSEKFEAKKEYRGLRPRS